MKALKSRDNQSTEGEFIHLFKENGIKGWRRGYIPDIPADNGKNQIKILFDYTERACPFFCACFVLCLDTGGERGERGQACGIPSKNPIILLKIAFVFCRTIDYFVNICYTIL